ncbi:flavin-containing monooxygenase FMO GS-OX4 isoform X2 [Chanos chanos]|uniref:Flavin-containing monooxygenase n=1 Tax=Chanos chanos TaxID=29144 RepID=A0A6J2WVK5_CHACN|nr:flavin-containing monooxygenase FMO GS-OX4-like isoform X2 [Chanos chanos]
MSQSGKLRVAVIGAGAAGLCVARHILARPLTFVPPVVYELTDHVGGTWFYEERVGTDDNGYPIHSSMYRDLRTNLPKEVMMFPDFPFDPKLPSFLHHQDVLHYLENYCNSHAITPHIKFSTVVEEVKPITMETEREGALMWEVISCGKCGGQSTEMFDSVFVCSGHYSDPHVPSIPGLEHFKGTVMHSHSYRYPEPFSGQSIVVLGAGASGVDISIELAQANAQVILSHNKPALPFSLPAGVRQAAPVVRVLEDGSFEFQDGSLAHAQVLMLCTGYNFTFPFLHSTQLGLQVQEHLITPLYKFLVPPAYPSLFFVGICKVICPFVHFNCQVQFALAILDGTVKLPSREEMEKEVRREMQEKAERGVQTKHLLKMDSEQWDYYKMLARTVSHSDGWKEKRTIRSRKRKVVLVPHSPVRRWKQKLRNGPQ